MKIRVEGYRRFMGRTIILDEPVLQLGRGESDYRNTFAISIAPAELHLNGQYYLCPAPR